MTELANLINILIERAKNQKKKGVITAYVYGDFGYGKTAYALWAAYEVLGSWDKVLNYLVFSPRDALNILADAVYGEKRLPILILDDAGLWLGKLTWWEDDKVAFMEFFNLVRSVATGVIFTSAADELPKPIRNKAFFRINVTPASFEEVEEVFRSEEELDETLEYLESLGIDPYQWSKATGYKLKTLPSFFQYPKKKFVDYFPQEYPIYEEYEKKRKVAIIEAYEKWKERFVEKELERTKERNIVKALAEELMVRGMSKREVVKILIRHGIPRRSAYYLLEKVR